MKLSLPIFVIMMLCLWIAAGAPSIDHMLQSVGVL